MGDVQARPRIYAGNPRRKTKCRTAFEPLGNRSNQRKREDMTRPFFLIRAASFLLFLPPTAGSVSAYSACGISPQQTRSGLKNRSGCERF